jgi:hypothetical protein
MVWDTRQTMAALTLQTILARSESLVTAPLGHELVMMDIESGTYYTLDDVGSFIWSQLDAPTSVADLLSQLQRRYEVSPEQCQRDVMPFLERIFAKQIISAVNR